MNKAKFYTMRRDNQPGCNHSYFSCTCPSKPVLVDGYNIDGHWGTYMDTSGGYKCWRIVHYASGLSTGKRCRTRKEAGEHLQELKDTGQFDNLVTQHKEYVQGEVDTFNRLLTEMGVQQYNPEALERRRGQK